MDTLTREQIQTELNLANKSLADLAAKLFEKSVVDGRGVCLAAIALVAQLYAAQIEIGDEERVKGLAIEIATTIEVWVTEQP